MADHPYNTPDLTSVLQTLSSLTSQNNSSQTPDRSISHDPRRQNAGASSNNTPVQTAPRPRPSSSSKPANTSLGDPSTITTWPAALRYVMKTVGQNEETQLRIRGLIRSQHSHERQWWKGREALLQRQQARGEKKKELDAVLQSIGAPVDSKEISSTQEDQAELTNYDTKIYRASVKMADALVAELRGFKIPFFVLQREMVHSQEATTHTGENSETDSSKLSQQELASFQRRMLELLEDLCKE
ncbi:hypothetical protein N7456_011865 [Penicillium angulare]|uniref:Uncharacterized protein n=1 Tax=Penicillium angulare TaxID=116970 RepID=A0A9W9EUN8_9EURO|nr:hypothetical protein N7456_011865 [Penicillium angulare]